jgi:hypothetical protein
MTRVLEITIPELLHKWTQGQIPENAKVSLVYDDSTPEKKTTATTELIKKWREEDAKMTPEEIEAENRLFDEVIEGINEVRRNSGMRTI